MQAKMTMTHQAASPEGLIPIAQYAPPDEGPIDYAITVMMMLSVFVSALVMFTMGAWLPMWPLWLTIPALFICGFAALVRHSLRRARQIEYVKHYVSQHLDGKTAEYLQSLLQRGHLDAATKAAVSAHLTGEDQSRQPTGEWVHHVPECQMADPK